MDTELGLYLVRCGLCTAEELASARVEQARQRPDELIVAVALGGLAAEQALRLRDLVDQSGRSADEVLATSGDIDAFQLALVRREVRRETPGIDEVLLASAGVRGGVLRAGITAFRSA